MALVRVVLLVSLAALAAAIAFSDPTGKMPKMHLPAPEHLTRKRQGTPRLTVEYYNSNPTDEVKNAVQFAFNILENTFVFTQTVFVRFEFAALKFDPTIPNILGSCTANQFAPCPPPAATQILYASALYKQLENITVVSYNSACSQEQSGTGQTWDILAKFNSDAPFAYSGNPTNSQYDFVYTFLHEMLHGLGFSGGITLNANKQIVNVYAAWAQSPLSGARCATAFDFLIADADGNFPSDAWVINNDANAWQTAYNRGPLSIVTSFSDAAAVQDYRPIPYVAGSSWYHLGDQYAGTSNQMMCHSLSPGSVIHTPGVLTLRIMQQMGWQLQSGALTTAQQATTITGGSGLQSGGNTALATAAAPIAALVALFAVLVSLVI